MTAGRLAIALGVLAVLLVVIGAVFGWPIPYLTGACLLLVVAVIGLNEMAK